MRHASTSGPGHLEPGRRVVGAAGVVAPRRYDAAGRAGCPSHDSPACAVLRRGAAESTATSDALGTLRPGRGHAGVADEGPLADLDPLHAQPAAAELVAADQGVVGQERLVVDLGERRDHQHRRRLDVLADPGAEQPQPGRRQARGVEREQPGPGVVEHPDRRPDRQRRPAAHRVHARPHRQPGDPDHDPDQQWPAPASRPAPRPAARPSRPSRSAYDAGSSASSSGSAAPASTATIGRQDSSTATTPYATVQPRLVAGRADHGPRARFWIRSAGEPDQYSPVGHHAEHRRARRDLGVLADVGAGAEHAARTDPGPRADPHRAEVHARRRRPRSR